MKSFTIPAPDLYAVSRRTFYRYIPDCEVNFVHHSAQMFFNLRRVAEDSPKSDRRKVIALVIKKCPAEQRSRVVEWLTDYFSPDMQRDIFDLTISNGKILPEKMLEKALNKIN